MKTEDYNKFVGRDRALKRRLYHPGGLSCNNHGRDHRCPICKHRPFGELNKRQREALMSGPGGVLRTREWRGSTVEPVEHEGRPANKITHPSGATMHLWAEPAKEER